MTQELQFLAPARAVYSVTAGKHLPVSLSPPMQTVIETRLARVICQLMSSLFLKLCY